MMSEDNSFKIFCFLNGKRALTGRTQFWGKSFVILLKGGVDAQVHLSAHREKKKKSANYKLALAIYLYKD